MEMQVLDEIIIENILKNIINSGYMFVTIVLNKGDLLFGRFNPSCRVFSEIPDKSEDLWIKDYDERIRGFETYKIHPIVLVFGSNTTEIPYDLISDIKPLNWAKNSIPFRYHGDINCTNLKLISKHNTKVTKKYGLNKNFIIFNSLPKDQICSEGIKFDNDELIYADNDFISLISGGTSLSLNASHLSFNPGRTDYQLALDKVKNGKIEKIKKYFLGNSPLNEFRCSGYIKMPKSELLTDIEGEKSIVAFCSIDKSSFQKKEVIPVILKKNSFCYPKEFFPHIKSKMIFYGELKQIPVKNEEISSDYALITRVIAYIKKSDNNNYSSV